MSSYHFSNKIPGLPLYPKATRQCMHLISLTYMMHMHTSALADPRGGAPGTRPPGVQFLAKILKIIAILGVGAPPWGKSWIRHCSGRSRISQMGTTNPRGGDKKEIGRGGLTHTHTTHIESHNTPHACHITPHTHTHTHTHTPHGKFK